MKARTSAASLKIIGLLLLTFVFLYSCLKLQAEEHYKYQLTGGAALSQQSQIKLQPSGEIKTNIEGLNRSLGWLTLPGDPDKLTWAQAKDQAPQFVRDQTKYQVTVAVKLIQVYVTDRKGAPVSDLTPEDFEVYDNNKPVSLMHFEKHLFSPETLASAASPSAESESLGRKFFLFFDFAFTDSRGVLRAKEAALKFLDSRLLPNDQIAVLTYTALGGLNLLEYLTRDINRIRQIVSDFGIKNATGRAESLTRFYYSEALSDQDVNLSDLKAPVAGFVSPEDNILARRDRNRAGQTINWPVDNQDYIQQAQFLLISLNRLAKVLRTVPGYKHIILFSGGLARQVLFGRTGGPDLVSRQGSDSFLSELREYDASRPDLGLRSDFNELLTELKASSCVVFTVDVSRPIDREVGTTNLQSLTPAGNELDGSESLRQLAQETGGRFYAATVNPQTPAEEITNLTGSYYVLGFKVDERWDGQFHKIKVKVKRKGLEVYAQAGYYDPKPFNKYTSFEKLINLIELALDEQPVSPFIPVEIPVASLSLRMVGEADTMVFARADSQAISEIISSKAEAYLLLFNEHGDLDSIRKFKIALKDKEKQENKIFLPSFLFVAKPGHYKAVLILRNMRTGESARGWVPVMVSAEKPQWPFVDSPLLLIAAQNTREICPGSQPSLAWFYGYNRAEFSPVAGIIPATAQSLFAAIRLQAPVGSEEGLSVSARLDKAGSGEIKSWLPLIRYKIRDEELLKLLLELKTGALSPGKYRITFIFSGPKISGEIKTESVFEVR
ncbi:MAG: VWA domain-containing protein [Candidatus Saccharicenans sp.]